jgi:hypothetical protein
VYNVSDYRQREIHNVYNVSDYRQREIHTVEPLVPDPTTSEDETVIAKLKKCNSPGSDQTLSELSQSRCETLLSVIHIYTNSIKK